MLMTPNILNTAMEDVNTKMWRIIDRKHSLVDFRNESFATSSIVACNTSVGAGMGRYNQTFVGGGEGKGRGFLFFGLIVSAAGVRTLPPKSSLKSYSPSLCAAH